jgi:glycosyltransferase involved in cell wall biosynthesis
MEDLMPSSDSGSLHVLIVSERFHPEEFRINDLARDWVQRGHDVCVLTQVPSYPQGHVFPGWVNRAVLDEIWDGAHICRVPTVTGYECHLGRKLLNYLSFLLWGSWAAWRHGGRPDVIFSFNTGPLTSVVPAALLARWRRVPLVVWTQDLWPDSVWAYGFRRTPLREAVLDAFVRFVYRRAARVLVSCDGFRGALAPYLPPWQLAEFVPNWADELDPQAAPSTLFEPGCFHFTFAGNLGKVQNLDRVLTAFASLPADLLASVRLNLVGDGSQAAALKERVKREGIPSVRFLGRVPASEMASVYRASHVLLVTLEDQPLFKLTVPSKFQTCLAAGKPILAAVGGEVNRLVEEEGVGLAVEPGDVAGIRRLLEDFAMLDEGSRSAMGGRGRALLERVYRREAILETLNEVLLNTGRNLEKR